MRLAVFGAVSTTLAVAIVVNAFLANKQFFSSCVHLTRSAANMMVLLNMGLFLTILEGRALVRLFFGELRTIEVEHLHERSWYAVTETCIAMTVFRDEFNVMFLGLFAFLLYIKIFHWIVQDRVDMMEQATNIDWKFHTKMLTIMFFLLFMDVLGTWGAVLYTYHQGPSMMIIFGFEFTILVSQIIASITKYGLHAIDLQSEEPWEDKSMYIFYLDLIVDFVKLTSYCVFFGAIVHFYGFPLHIVRDLYMTLRSFMKRVQDLIQYRRATANMHQRYPDATTEEIRASDGVCIICREEMVAANENGNNNNNNVNANRSVTPKKLPCGHIFHFRCLRTWLERQQSCPTCRRTVLVDATSRRSTVAAVNPPAANAPPAPAPAPAPAQQPPQTPQQPQQTHTTQPASASATDSVPSSTTTTNPPAIPPNPPPYPVLIPLFPPTAPPPFSATRSFSSTRSPFHIPDTAGTGSVASSSVFSHMSDKDLLEYEGKSREAVLKRIELVKDIQDRLDGVVSDLVGAYELMGGEEVRRSRMVSEEVVEEAGNKKGKERVE